MLSNIKAIKKEKSFSKYSDEWIKLLKINHKIDFKPNIPGNPLYPGFRPTTLMCPSTAPSTAL